jgi:hypothetical protein
VANGNTVEIVDKSLDELAKAPNSSKQRAIEMAKIKPKLLPNLPKAFPGKPKFVRDSCIVKDKDGKTLLGYFSNGRPHVKNAKRHGLSVRCRLYNSLYFYSELTN